MVGNGRTHRTHKEEPQRMETSETRFSARPARREDFPVIAAFPRNEEEQYYMYPRGTFPLDPEQLAREAGGRVRPTVVLDGEAVIGYCNMYGVESGSHGWLGNVIIDPDSRGKGAGRFLVETMAAIARDELGLRELRLVCHNTNTAALRLYWRTGFKPYDLEGPKDDSGRMRILMKRVLADA
jgi:ribosomal protein S18 acetylase RimI-like enzyme